MLDEKFWEKYFRVYDALNSLVPYQDLLRSLEEELDLKPDDVVLDLGSGSGNVMMKLKGKCREIIGIDYSLEGVKIHKKKDPLAKVIIADISKELPFGDNYFSKIVSNNVIYTLGAREQQKLIQEMYRIVNSGGKVVISNIKKDFSPFAIYANHLLLSIKLNGIFITLRTLVQLIIPNLKILYFNRKIKQSGIEKSYHFLSAEEQKLLLENAGFKDVSVAKATYAGQAIMHSGHK